jgi:MoxR-like ATPase
MCDSVRDRDLHEMLNRTHDGETRTVFGDPRASEPDREEGRRPRQGRSSPARGPARKPPQQQLATVNHFRLLRRLLLVRDEQWTERAANEFRRSFLETFRVYRREFQISDRSLARFYRLAQGLAFVRGRDDPSSKDLDAFKYCFRDMEAAAALSEAVDYRLRGL